MDIDSAAAEANGAASAATALHLMADGANTAHAVDNAAMDASTAVDASHAAYTAAMRSFTGMVIGKLAVRGHARLVARALWQSMRQRIMLCCESTEEQDSGVRGANGSAKVPDVPAWGDSASLGAAGTSTPRQPCCVVNN